MTRHMLLFLNPVSQREIQLALRACCLEAGDPRATQLGELSSLFGAQVKSARLVSVPTFHWGLLLFAVEQLAAREPPGRYSQLLLSLRRRSENHRVGRHEGLRVRRSKWAA